MILVFSLDDRLLLRHSIFIGRFKNVFLKVLVCWSANISVGTRIAVCSLDSLAKYAARIAMIVLPEPTSPCMRRLVGYGFKKLFLISETALI